MNEMIFLFILMISLPLMVLVFGIAFVPFMWLLDAFFKLEYEKVVEKNRELESTMVHVLENDRENGSKKPTFGEFCLLVGEIYDSLPEEIRSKFSVNIEESPSQASLEIMGKKRLSNLYGFWHPISPTNVTLCYWGFKRVGDFSKSRIADVLKHEFEHSVTEPFGLKHSEHR